MPFTLSAFRLSTGCVRSGNQTVLGMLPEIVRAAAEPRGNIESLTVLSSDGAPDVVKTTTRIVAEASAAVQSLTGLDIPALINDAVRRVARSLWAAVPERLRGTLGDRTIGELLADTTSR